MILKEFNIGEQVGGYKIIRRVPDKKTSRYFDVICEYGNEHTKAASDLDGSHCKKRECIKKGRLVLLDKISACILSKKYGIWQALKQLPLKTLRGRESEFLCRCDCGEERILTSRQLITKNARPVCKNIRRGSRGQILRPSRYIPVALRAKKSGIDE